MDPPRTWLKSTSTIITYGLRQALGPPLRPYLQLDPALGDLHLTAHWPNDDKEHILATARLARDFAIWAQATTSPILLDGVGVYLHFDPKAKERVYWAEEEHALRAVMMELKTGK